MFILPPSSLKNGENSPKNHLKLPKNPSNTVPLKTHRVCLKKFHWSRLLLFWWPRQKNDVIVVPLSLPFSLPAAISFFFPNATPVPAFTGEQTLPKYMHRKPFFLCVSPIRVFFNNYIIGRKTSVRLCCFEWSGFNNFLVVLIYLAIYYASNDSLLFPHTHIYMHTPHHKTHREMHTDAYVPTTSLTNCKICTDIKERFQS